MNTGTEKHVSFQTKEQTHKAPGGAGGAVASAVDTGIAAVAQAGDAVLRHIPGTDEHALDQCKKQIEKTGVDFHVADDIAYECGPAAHSNTREPTTALPKDPHTVDDLAYGVEGPPGNESHFTFSTVRRPNDVCHTADDLDFVKGEFVKPAPALDQRDLKAVDPHTADDLAFTKGVGGVGKKTGTGAGAPSDVVHTADDIAFTRKET